MDGWVVLLQEEVEGLLIGRLILQGGKADRSITNTHTAGPLCSGAAERIH